MLCYSSAASAFDSVHLPQLTVQNQCTGGMAVAAAVLTTTEGEEVGTVDTAAAVTSEAGGTPTVARTRYEFDLPWTPEEEQKLAAASSLNPGSVSGSCLSISQLLHVLLCVSIKRFTVHVMVTNRWQGQ